MKLTDDFVQIARVASEGVCKEEAEISSILCEAMDRAFPLAQQKQISLEFDVSEDLVFANVDVAALSRALDNLIGNAIKFSPVQSRVSLTLDLSDPDCFEISVADEGPGLPPERVAEPFARFGAKSNTAGPSSGLGLAYVKQVVEKHSGSITVQTNSGIGTVFRLTLPYG